MILRLDRCWQDALTCNDAIGHREADEGALLPVLVLIDSLPPGGQVFGLDAKGLHDIPPAQPASFPHELGSRQVCSPEQASADTAEYPVGKHSTA